MFRLLLTALLLITTHSAVAQDWPQWRGPSGDNHAAQGATAPTEWGENTNIVWRTLLPGRGHSSPTIVGDRIYLTTAVKSAGTQSLLVFDKQTGELLKETVAHQGGIPARIHGNNTHASPTVASDSKRVYSLFYTSGAAWATAYDFDGNLVWQQRVCAFDPAQYQFGFGPSPRIDSGVLIVAAEYDGADSGIYGLNPANGKRLWKAKRPQTITFSTPIATNLGGRRQLLISGADQIASYDPKTGRQLWTQKGSAAATCGTMIWDAKSGLAFASGGYPNSFTLAIAPTGNHRIIWQNRSKNYEQSMLCVDGFIYAHTDQGIAYCWRATDGKEMWRERLRGPVSSSPLLVGDNIYASNERGVTYVFKASPERFELVAENQLGDDCFPTPTPSNGRLYHRYGERTGNGRQEYLVAIGE